MPTTYSTSLRLSLIATGEQAGTWGNTTNTNLGTLLEQAITGYTSISMLDANYTLTALNGSSDESRNANIKMDGGTTLTATRVIIIPNVKKTYYFWNATTGTQSIRIGTSSTPTTYVDIPNGYGCYVFCDGSNAVYQQSPFINASTGAVSLGATSVTTLTASSTVTGTGLIPSGSSIPSNGIYLPSANTVGLSTNSTARFYFGSAGQIGIGGATYGTSGQALLSGGASAAPTWGDVVTSVGQSFTGGLISVSGSPITASGTLALTVAGTSGGIPYFDSASTWASSGALAANAIVIGGGAGASPATTTTGTGVLTALGNTVNGAGGILTPDGTATLTGKTISGASNTITNVSLTTGVTGTLPTANGGTNLTTFTAANNAIYSTSSSALTAGTLPVAAGGTGQTTYTDGQLLIGNSTGNTLSKATLTAGTGIAITNGSGTITIAQSSSGGATTIASGSLSGTSVTIGSIPATYSYLVLHISGASFNSSTGSPRLLVQIGTDNTSSNYSGYYIYDNSSTPTLGILSLASLGYSSTLSGAANTYNLTMVLEGYQGGSFPSFKTYSKETSDTTGIQTIGNYIANTTAVSSIRIYIDGTKTFDAGTYTLLGIA